MVLAWGCVVVQLRVATPRLVHLSKREPPICIYMNELFSHNRSSSFWLSLLNETGCILKRKTMPDVTIMVPELVIVKKRIQNPDFNEELWWNEKLPDLAPIDPPISYVVLRNSWAQVAKWRSLKRLLACASTSTSISTAHVE
jgi:hypothetical protein